MTKRLFLCAGLAAAMLFTSCNAINDGVSDIGSGVSDVTSDLSSGMSDVESDLSSDLSDGRSDMSSDMSRDESRYDNSSDISREESSKDAPASGASSGAPELTASEEPANTPTGVTSSSVDLSSLDNTKQGWGQGVQLDEKNRPLASLSFQEKYGKYDAWFIGEEEPVIYLTFDCGYENGYTPMILDTLLEKDVPAVFFCVSDYVERQPELVQRMIDEGHIVGNHSVNHPSFPDLSAEECRQEIMELHDYVKENFGYEMSLFRFPMGEFSEADLKVVQDLGYRSVFWSFAYRDWLVDEQPDPQEAIATIEDKCHPGAIYLLHAVSETNAQILGQVIDDLRGEGYVFCAYQ